MNTQEFIQRSREVHGDKYLYDKTVFVKAKERVIITCTKHGDFLQKANYHYKGGGCIFCGRETSLEKQKFPDEHFYSKAKKAHGDKYDYSKTEYRGTAHKVKIICPVHGEFEQKAAHHIEGKGCQECKKVSIIKSNQYTHEDFINKATKVHKGKYSYNKSEYIDSDTKIVITCSTHGDFTQNPSLHLGGQGCKACGIEKRNRSLSLSESDFITRSTEKHKGLYDYSKVNYFNSKTKVTIICKKHGEFVQTPNGHLLGKGCSKCGAENSERLNETLLKRNKNKYLTVPYYLYLLEFSKDQEVFLKVGITNNTKTRFNKFKNSSGYNIKLLKIVGNNLYACGMLENHILKNYIKYTPDLKFAGYTECFPVTMLEILIQELDNTSKWQ